ncbi:MAG: methyltransferase [Bacteroidota bacterium]
MSNSYFQFKQFTVHQEHCAMKVCTDACLFGAWSSTITRPLRIRSVLDIGTGTGLLSLMLAQHSDARIDAIELDEAAALQATDNFEASPWHERLQVIRADARTVHLGKYYELIVSNPPFFDNDLKSGNAQRNLALHSDALSFEELLASILKHLATDGKFAVLLPYHRRNEFVELALRKGFFQEAEVSVQQTPLHSFFRSMLLFGRKEVEVSHSIIVIRNEDEYTPAFSELLKDYYLKL